MEELNVRIKDLEMIFEGKEILNISELSVYENDKIGIIGENGSGKSTLLRLLVQELIPTKGSIQLQTDFQIYQQIADVNEQKVLDLDGELLSRFGVPTNEVATLSGGETSKYRLTQLLSAYHPAMLLDEPTTHLDTAGKKQLIEELRYYYGTLLFVSHDREFLNELAEKIWEVKNGKVVEYKGNYDAYVEQKEQESLQQQREFQEYQKEVTRLTKGIQAKKQKAEQAGKVSDKSKNKNIRPSRLSSSKQKDTVQKNLYKQAKAMTSRLKQLQGVSDVERKHKITFPKHPSAEIHNPFPIRGENITIAYDGKIILENLDFQIPLGQKIALIGDNGAGKSTLLKWILENGEGIVFSPKVKMETYQQMDYRLDQPTPLLDELMSETDWSEATVRSMLHNLGFSQLGLKKPLNVLSGGEATRLAIAKLFTKPSNFLILDEPTNSIDLNTIEALENFLKEYQGTVLFTSHDKNFIEKVADQVWEIKNKQLVI